MGDNSDDVSMRLSDSWDDALLLDHVDYASLLIDLDALRPLTPVPSAVDRDAASCTDDRVMLHAAGAAERAKRSAGTGKKRTKRKDEVALLREQAAWLQEQLDLLTAHWKHKSLALMAQSSSGSQYNRKDCRTDVTSAEPKWRAIAAHRRDQLTAAELQNGRLKAQVQLHKRALHRIRKLLAKRVVFATRELDAFFQLDLQHIRVGSMCAFHMLLAESDAMDQSFPKAQLAMHSHDINFDERRDWKLHQDTTHGFSIEMAARYVVPSDAKCVEKALRGLYAQRDGEQRVYEFFNASEDMILTQFVAGYRNSAGSGNVRTQYALRQFSGDRGARFLISGVIDRLEATGESKNLPRLREKTCTTITRCASSTPRQPVSVIETWYTMIPEVGASSYTRSDNLWKRATVQQILIPILDRSMAKFQRELEKEIVNLGAKLRRQTLEG